MSRQPGYYWVKADGKWIVAEFYDNRWWHTGMDYHVPEPPEIDERRIIPPDEVISEGEAWNVLFILANTNKDNTGFIEQMKRRFDIILTAKPA
jgi:hypothetical protein